MKDMAVHNDMGMQQLKGSVGITAGYTVAPARAMIDTGSDVSYVTPRLAALIGAKIIPWVEGQYAAVAQADKTTIKLVGWIRGMLCIGGNSYPNVFFVPRAAKSQPKEAFEMLIGNDLLWRIGELNVNYAIRKLTLRDHHTKFAYTFTLDPTTVDTIIVPADANKDTFWAGGENEPGTTPARTPPRRNRSISESSMETPASPWDLSMRATSTPVVKHPGLPKPVLVDRNSRGQISSPTTGLTKLRQGILDDLRKNGQYLIPPLEVREQLHPGHQDQLPQVRPDSHQKHQLTDLWRCLIDSQKIVTTRWDRNLITSLGMRWKQSPLCLNRQLHLGRVNQE